MLSTNAILPCINQPLDRYIYAVSVAIRLANQLVFVDMKPSQYIITSRS